MKQSLEEKLSDLKTIIHELESVAVAFSGGVDSTLVLKVCHDVLGDRAIAVTARSETYPHFEFAQAQQIARDIGVRHIVIDTEELGIEGFAGNPPDRCYFCKKELFQKLQEVAVANDIKTVADGANFDDTHDHRPGLRAAKELGVRSPLKEAGLTKDEIRAASRRLGLSTWDKPAYACLSSRFPYGQTITGEKLEMVAKGEEFLRKLGLRQFRVRHHDTIARIEVPPADIAEISSPGIRGRIVEEFKKIGYTYVTIDLEGFRSGSMNEVLDREE